MSERPLNPIASVDPADSQQATWMREQFRAAIARGDVESVTDVAKAAYAEMARLRNLLHPHVEAFNCATFVLMEYLAQHNREALNDDDFDIGLTKQEFTIIKDESRLYDALHALRIDGKPLPAEVLKEAAFIDLPPPPEPVKKANLTKIKPLVKRYGKAIQDAIDACITQRPKPRHLIFSPKEHILTNDD